MVPIRKLDSNLANFLVRLDLEVISAIYPKAAGLVADPISPFIRRPKKVEVTNKQNLKYFFQQGIKE